MAFRDEWKSITKGMRMHAFENHQRKIDAATNTLRILAKQDEITEQREKRVKGAVYKAFKNRRKFKKAANSLGVMEVMLNRSVKIGNVVLKQGDLLSVKDYLNYTHPYRVMHGRADWKESGLEKRVANSLLIRGLASLGTKAALTIAAAAIVISTGIHMAMPLSPPVTDAKTPPFGVLVNEQQTGVPTKNIIEQEKEKQQEQLPSVPEVAVGVLAFCETSGDLSSVASNFDGMGISVGFYQANIGSGTLQKNVKKFLNENQDSARAVFGNSKYKTMCDMFCGNKTIEEQLEWAKSIHGEKGRLDPDWKKCFEAMAANPDYMVIQLNDMNNFWLQNAYKMCDEFGLQTDKGLAFALSVVVNSGSVTGSAKQYMQDEFGLTPDAIKGLPEDEAMQLILESQLATQIGSGWRDSYRRRHETIINGSGEVHVGTFVTFNFTGRTFTAGEKIPADAGWTPPAVVVPAIRDTIPNGRN